MKKLIIVADWASDTMTCQEVRSAIEGFLKDPTSPNITYVSSTPSTHHTAFLLAQITEIEERYGRPLETVIYQNTDPRTHTDNRVENAAGAEFVVIRLKSGIHLCGPNAGFNFSLIKNRIDVIFVYKGLESGSQFRSRDLFPRVGAHLMDAMEDELDLEEIPLDKIPEIEGYFIGHIDNYGNIKTNITHEDMKGKYQYGDKVKVKINEVEMEATYVDNLFGLSPGALIIYPGSSGHKDNPYIEITIWRHFTGDRSTGAHVFNDPVPGSKIELIER